MDCLFTFLIMSFDAQIFYILMKSGAAAADLFFFLVAYAKKTSPNPKP